MKKIHIIRHPKSCWSDLSMPDMARPLNKRGKDTCKFMAEHILKAGCSFENAFCSPALRAQSTIKKIAKELSSQNISWTNDDRLYTFDGHDLLDWFNQLDNSLSEVLMIGHNPAIIELCHTISDTEFNKVPTCAYIQLTLDLENWSDVKKQSAHLQKFIYPRMYR